ncbi:hypothetical protein GIB67_018790 [Kingdonia uniflora]|uniref:Uncharacterized protein n=1 Tax=Kingdonia uniflora TaxID=39325 RepID=A0A7J7NDU6_9MAGN|nr:hypothetical protein GIB67_018790 [Kingdonia uniflora]
MVSTRDRLKQTNEKLVSPLKIHRKPNLKKNGDLEMGDPNERLTILGTTVSTLTSTVGELVEQLCLTDLAKASTSVEQRGRLKKKGVMEVDGDENVPAMGRAATSLSKLADTVREELPSTMAAIRLSGIEIRDLTLELSDLSIQHITMEVGAAAVHEAVVEELIEGYDDIVTKELMYMSKIVPHALLMRSKVCMQFEDEA